MTRNALILASAAALLLLGSFFMMPQLSSKAVNINLGASVPVVPINGKWITTKVDSLNSVVIMQLAYNGTDTWYISPNNPISKFLTVEFFIDTHNEFTVKIFDRVNTNRFTLPYQKPFPFNKAQDTGSLPSEYKYSFSKVNEQFYLVVSRAGSVDEVIFDTRTQNFMFSDKFMEISTSVNNNFIFGLGERRQRFKFRSGSYSFWNKDAPTHNEDGKPNGQLYGTHPMYLKREKNSNFHVGFLRNAGASLVEYVEDERLTFRLTSSIIEFKYFLGDNKPETAIQMYHAYVNGYSLHPFWASGFHQCRWGYKNSGELLDVWNSYNKNNLPFDTLWSDIDYMQNLWDFTIDTGRFKVADMQKFSNYTNDKLGVRWVPIIDAGVAIAHESADRGQQLDTFIQSTTYNGQNLVGCVWPGKVHYTDFNHPNAQQFWTEGLKNISQHYNVVPNGIWIDMNEFSNFKNGEIPLSGGCDSQTVEKEFLKLEANVDQLQSAFQYPYNPTGNDHPLDEKAMSLDAYHYCGPDSPIVPCANQSQILEFDFHNLDGFSEGIATHNALKELGNPLPFIITRSSLFGSGAYVQHWTGDNDATWTDLYLSISEIFNFNMFAIPFVGADICGFAGETTPELCARWMQLGALYPFSRNHNVEGSQSQEPYAFPNYPYVLSSSRQSLQLRYSILKHYYTLFVKNNGTGTVFKPLFFEFPNDADSLFDIDWEFMLGEAILGAPVLIQAPAGTQTTRILVTFPKNEVFFDYFYGVSYNNVGTAWYDSPLDSAIPLFLRAGYIVATQDVSTVLRARDLTNKFNLKIGLRRQDENLFIAEGSLITVSDYSENNIVNKCVGTHNCILNIFARAAVDNNTLQVTVTFNGADPNTVFETIIIDSIEIYGYQDFVGNYSNDIKKFFVYKDNVITQTGQQLIVQATI